MGKNRSTRTLALTAALTAAALVVFVIEAQLPPLTAVPGIKPGLSNVFTLFALCRCGAPWALGLTLVRVRLYTGRTHQIRVQFSSRGWPLTGDGKYGSRNNRCAPALWSAELHFAHPVTGETLIFRSQPPEAYPWTLFSPDSL